MSNTKTGITTRRRMERRRKTNPAFQKFAKGWIVKALFCVCLLVSPVANAAERHCSVTRNDDGGYSLTIEASTQSGSLTDDAGYGPCTIRLLGGGVNRGERDHDGFYYSMDAIIGHPAAGDFGYAWVDRKRERICINMYWAAAPDSLVSSDVNGCYEIAEGERAADTDADGKIKVEITGQVIRPGEYFLAAGASLGNALDLAVVDPAPWHAMPRRVQVRRKTDGGWQETVHDCRDGQSEGRNFILQDGDEIKVPRML